MSGKTNIKRTVLGIDHIYKDFNGKRRARKKLHRAIIKEYLKIYFTEVLYTKDPMYFFMSGLIKKMYVGNFVGDRKNFDNTKVFFNKSVGFLWYDRPHFHLAIQIKLKKMNGVYGNLTKLIKEWRKWNSLDELDSLRRYMKNNKLYRENYNNS